MRVTLDDIPASRFTAATVRKMYQLADAGKVDHRFQKLIYGVVNRAMPGKWKNYRAELEALLRWFKARHDYRRDPHNVELLQDVWATLDRKRFDCDDSSIFLASAAEILGAPTRFVTVSTRRDKEPSHVYVQALVDGQWLGMDAIVPESTLGWEPSAITDRKIWPRSSVGLSGLLSGLLGALMNNGKFVPTKGFASRGMEWWVTPGSDRAKTWAAPEAGDMMVSRADRYKPTISEVADPRRMPRAGGGVFGKRLPIHSAQRPDEKSFLYPRDAVPRPFDPDKPWMAPPLPANLDHRQIFPQSTTPFADYLEDSMQLAGLEAALGALPAEAVDDLTGKVVNMVKTGQIPSTQEAIDTAIKTGVAYYGSRVKPSGAGLAMPAIPGAAPLATTTRSRWTIPLVVGGGLLAVGLGIWAMGRR
ncbi:MAG: transglutaminase domain-containing protein [Planctomycetota bacterium]